MFKQKPEVLVVGAGPVGLVTALFLAKSGIRVQIADTGRRACAHSYALGLHPQTLKLLDEHGWLAAVREQAYPIRQIGLFDDVGRRAHIAYDRAYDRQSENAYLSVLSQSCLEGVLEQALREQGIQVQWRHEAVNLIDSDEGVRVTLNRLESDEWTTVKSIDMTVPFVIGADGHNSRVRRALNLEFPETGPARYYTVFEFKTDADLDHELRIVLGKRTTDILWPLPGGYCRWAFEMPGYDHSQVPARRAKERSAHSEWGHLTEVSEESIGTLLEERAPWFDGGVEKFTWRTLVRFEQRLAPRFGRGRIWLAGDAAHLAGPAGVQSMNMGILEGRDLAAGIAGILREGASVHSLEGYNQSWSRTWQQLHGLNAGLVATPEADVWIAENAGRLLPCLPGSGRELETLAGHLGLELRPLAQQAS